jgi:hypothetical protein
MRRPFQLSQGMAIKSHFSSLRSDMEFRKKQLTGGGFLVDEPAHHDLISGNVRIMQIGASWSLTSVQTAGEANVDNRNALCADSYAAGCPANWRAEVQWEYRAAGFSAQDQQVVWVCGPRLLQPRNILAPRSVLRSIISASKEAPLHVLKEPLDAQCSRLGFRLVELEDEPDEHLRERLIAQFAGLAPQWWRSLAGRVELEQLTRFVRGSRWVEVWAFPAACEPIGLHQDRRLSVFTLEGLFPKDQVQRTDYISTGTVIDHAIANASREGFVPDYIFLYCHEVHGRRARRQIVEKVWAHSALTQDSSWLLSPERVIYRGRLGSLGLAGQRPGMGEKPAGVVGV